MKKQLVGHIEGFNYFRRRGGQGACQHPNVCIVAYIKLYIYRGGKQVTGNARYFLLETIFVTR